MASRQTAESTWQGNMFGPTHSWTVQTCRWLRWQNSHTKKMRLQPNLGLDRGILAIKPWMKSATPPFKVRRASFGRVFRETLWELAPCPPIRPPVCQNMSVTRKTPSKTENFRALACRGREITSVEMVICVFGAGKVENAGNRVVHHFWHSRDIARYPRDTCATPRDTCATLARHLFFYGLAVSNKIHCKLRRKVSFFVFLTQESQFFDNGCLFLCFFLWQTCFGKLEAWSGGMVPVLTEFRQRHGQKKHDEPWTVELRFSSKALSPEWPCQAKIGLQTHFFRAWVLPPLPPAGLDRSAVGGPKHAFLSCGFGQKNQLLFAEWPRYWVIFFEKASKAVPRLEFLDRQREKRNKTLVGNIQTSMLGMLVQ